MLSADQIAFNLGSSMLILVAVERTVLPLSAEFRFVHYQSVELYARALENRALRIPTDENDIFRCLDPDGNILTFKLPERNEYFYIYFAGPEFEPELNEDHVKVADGHFYIGRGRRPGHPTYRSLEEAESALQNQRALQAPSRLEIF